MNRTPFTWYNMHDYDTDDGARPPSADECHRMAHVDGLCDCDEFPLSTGGVERS